MDDPRLPEEHPTLPRLDLELIEARPETRTPRGRLIRTARPAHVRAYFSPLPIIETASPARLRTLGLRLLAVASALEDEHRKGHPTPK